MLKIGDEFLKIIIDSGENENGRWIKYADGTMICTRTIPILYFDISEYYSAGNCYRSETYRYDFPQEFKEGTQIFGFVGVGRPFNYGVITDGGIDYDNPTRWRVRFQRNASGENLNVGDIYLLAIGRWK